MWMAAFWDFMKGDYSADQDWHHQQSMWSADLMMTAKTCHQGLCDMQNFKSQQSRVLRPSSELQVPRPASSPASDMENFMLTFMIAWTRRVAMGHMAHGPLLAHAVQCGHQLKKTTNKERDGSFTTFLVPHRRLEEWTKYDWQEHGRDGLAAVTKFLKLNGFWTGSCMTVSKTTAPHMARSQKEMNLVVLADTVPRAMWNDFNAPRGVKLFIHDETYLNDYKWSTHLGIPEDIERCFLRPESSVGAVPGTAQVTYYLQSKGHWFWAFFPHEGSGHLQVKWIRGRTPPGKLQWRPDYAADINMGVGRINDFSFVQGLYLEDAGRKFPLFLYMERPPRHGRKNEQLHLLACSEVPRPVEQTLHPGCFNPRRCTTPGPVMDPGRRQMMWQEGENGAVTFQVQDHIFWQAHPGAPVWRKKGTMSDWRSSGGCQWENIGTLNTEGVDAAEPDADIPEKWAFFLSDYELLAGADTSPQAPPQGSTGEEPEWPQGDQWPQADEWL